MKIHWTAAAQQDLAAILDYLAKENPVAAGDVLDRIERAVVPLEKFPGLGRPGRVAGTRELVVSGLPYILPYATTDDGLFILGVMHTARRWPDTF